MSKTLSDIERMKAYNEAFRKFFEAAEDKPKKSRFALYEEITTHQSEIQSMENKADETSAKT
jgi:uncharacterized protein Yka (UPF0111/DUF47 family)